MILRKACLRANQTQLVEQGGARWLLEGPVVYKRDSAGMALRLLGPGDVRAWAKRVPRAQRKAICHEARLLGHAESPLAPLALLTTEEHVYLVMPRKVGDAFAMLREVAHSYTQERRADTARRAICRRMALWGLRELQKLHERSIFHQDIKPEHLLFDFDGSVVLGDYGSAHMGPATSPSCATLGYLAPEGFSVVDCARDKIDVYALGASVLAMLSGVAPFLFRAAQSYALQANDKSADLEQHALELARAVADYKKSYDGMVRFAAQPNATRPEAFTTCCQPQWADCLHAAKASDTALLQVLLAMLHPESAQRPSAAAALALCRQHGVDGSVAAPIKTMAVRCYMRGRVLI